MGEITVVGSINIDIVAYTNKYPNHGDTNFGERMTTLPGGKGANQAVASAVLGKTVNMIGSIGKDLYGDNILQSLNNKGVNTTHIKRIDTSSTGCAIITVDQGAENTMLVVKGANDELSKEDIKLAFNTITDSKVLLVQMEVSEESVIEALIQGKNKGMFVILDPAPADGITKHALQYADLIVPNKQETKELTGIDVLDLPSAQQAANIFHQMGIKNSIIKMGSQGSFIFINGTTSYIEPITVNAVDTVGAGDTFAGALAFAIADGADIQEAVQFANIVAALKVTRQGAQSIPTLDEVNEFCKQKGLSHYIQEMAKA
ncbi:ribokinase [Fictibacillus solisalsi]|uniref:Ribokinase n=1 Tax=Fictibacillus solisalsi TaxID=459525 RepID=A0A1G9X807_9BACL|nr:ribokinase [Fictibacillus solisalsi]SDM92475.1 ribokinase [Fictibacillus solisalsi]